MDEVGVERSALVVRVPEAEAVVGPHRARLDRSAVAGVPAHVTVLYPFLAPEAIDAGVVERLAKLYAGLPAFGAALTAVRWFDESVVYVAPEPDEGFRALTAATCALFDGIEPYGGKHDDVVPHLTVGDAELGGPEELRAAGAAVSASLPIPVRVAEVSLLVGARRPDSWRTVHRFPLMP